MTMEYESNKRAIFEALDELCSYFPNKDLSEVIDLTIGDQILFIEDGHLLEVIREFNFQNM